MTHARLRLGASGEDLAARWYVDHGYSVVARNWRCSDGELDVIARKGNTVVFCEVKTRTSTAFGTPFDAVNPAKARRLRVLGYRWLRETKTKGVNARFDVASVLAGEIDVRENVL